MGGSSYLHGTGTGSYSPVPRYEAPSPAPARTSSPATTTTRAPAFKGTGMKLGSKKTKQSELLIALGGEAAMPEEVLHAQHSMPSTPARATPEPAAAKAARSSLPTVHAEG